jgi:polysaccharide export outer membrane protein
MRDSSLGLPSRSLAARCRATGWLVSLLAAVLLGSGCFARAVPPPAAQPPATYRIGAPDALLVSILPEPTIERQVVVRPDGRISIDLIGDVVASGLTTEQLAGEIRARISRFKRDAVVTVAVTESRSSTITIFGQVMSPGSQVLDRETRLAEAIGAAGGTNLFASKGRVRVVRSNPQETRILRVNLRDIQYGDQSTNFMLQDGDIVVVPPNAIARVGFALQTLLFPFQQVLSAGSAAFVVSQAF